MLIIIALFRLEDDHRLRNSFRNPIWENDEDDDDINDFRYISYLMNVTCNIYKPYCTKLNLFMNSRQPRNRFQFKVFSDPFEMTRFFETQMDDMMRNFFGAFDGFGNRFGPDAFGSKLYLFTIFL